MPAICSPLAGTSWRWGYFLEVGVLPGSRVKLASILATKLYVPPPPPRAVARTRLVERLDAGLAARRKVTLISAPAGFGKTTLVAAWLAGGDRRAAWLALDENDGDPARFLTYVTRALQSVLRRFRRGSWKSWQAPQLPPSMPFSPSWSTRLRQARCCWRQCGQQQRQYDHPRAGRLSRGRQPGGRRGAYLSDRTPAAAAAPGDHHARGSPAAAAPAARSRAADRAAGGGSAFYACRSGGVSQRGDGPCAHGGRSGGTGEPHGRLDRRAAAGGAVDAGACGRGRLYPGVCRRPPLYRGLPGRRGAGTAAGRCAQLSAADGNPRPAERGTV